jgi:hypothetical protein
VGCQRHAPVGLPPGKTRYPLHRRLGWPQGRSGQVRKISPLTGFDPRTVHPVASRYTDWTIPDLYLKIYGILFHYIQTTTRTFSYTTLSFRIVVVLRTTWLRTKYVLSDTQNLLSKHGCVLTDINSVHSYYTTITERFVTHNEFRSCSALFLPTFRRNMLRLS